MKSSPSGRYTWISSPTSMASTASPTGPAEKA